MNTLKKTIDDTPSIELEVRFSDKYTTKKNQSLSKYTYNRVMNDFYKDHHEHFTEQTSLDISYKNRTRLSIFPDMSQMLIQKKEIETIYNYLDLNAKLSIVDEIKKEKNNGGNIESLRYKKRNIFKFQNTWELHFTVVFVYKNANFIRALDDIKQLKNFSPLGQLSIDNIEYQIELEYWNKSSNTTSPEDFKKELDEITVDVCRKIQESNIPVKKSLYDSIFKEIGLRKFPGPLPRTILKSDLKHLTDKHEEFFVTEKADGERFLIVYFKNNVYLMNRKTNIFHLFSIEGSHKFFVLDSEFVNKNEFVVYDCYDSGVLSLGKRLIEAKKHTNFLNNQKAFKFTRKKFYPYTNDNVMKLLEKNAHNYEIDGLIFINKTKPYTQGSNKGSIYKWKFNELNTIDFYIEKTNKKHVEGYDVWNLYINTTEFTNKDRLLSYKSNKGVLVYSALKKTILRTTKESKDYKNTNNVNILFCPYYTKDLKDVSAGIAVVPTEESSRYLNHSIVECNYVKDDVLNTWSFRPIKSRPDKNTPNYINTALDTWDAIKNPVTIDDLTKNMYSSVVKDTQKNSETMRNFHNFIKKYLINKYKGNSNLLIDIATGQGGDIHKWKSENIKKVYAIDYSVDKINTARQRKQKIKDTNFIEFDQKDASEPFVYKQKADLVTMFFAIHFFFENEKMLNTLFDNVSKNLNEDGHFIITSFSGQKIHNLLKSITKDNLISYGENLFELLKLYNSNDVADEDDILKNDEKYVYGNKIKSTLHNTIVSDSSDVSKNGLLEYLVSYEFLKKIAKDHGFSLVEENNFEDFMNTYAKKLTENEKIYSFLNKSIVFKKNKKVEGKAVEKKVVKKKAVEKKAVEEKVVEDKVVKDKDELGLDDTQFRKMNECLKNGKLYNPKTNRCLIKNTSNVRKLKKEGVKSLQYQVDIINSQ